MAEIRRGMAVVMLAAICLLAHPVHARIIGVGVHLGNPRTDIAQSLDLAKAAGFQSIRMDLRWDHVEKQKGRLAMPPRTLEILGEAAKRDMKVLVILAYSNPAYGALTKPLDDAQLAGFTTYAQFVAATLKGKVWGYQVWNEWDWKTGGYPPGTAKDYMALAQSVVPVVRAADPQAVVISNSITYLGLKKGWLDDALESGMGRLFDGIAFNPYVQTFGAGMNTPEAMVTWIDGIVKRARERYGEQLKFYMTEMGWTVMPGFSRDLVADYAARTIDLVRDRGTLEGMWWYDLQDDGRDPNNGEHNYGLLDADMQPKPAFRAMQRALVRGHPSEDRPRD